MIISLKNSATCVVSCLKYPALHFFKIYEIIGFAQQSTAKIFRDPCAFLPDLPHFLSPKEKTLDVLDTAVSILQKTNLTISSDVI